MLSLDNSYNIDELRALISVASASRWTRVRICCRIENRWSLARLHYENQLLAARCDARRRSHWRGRDSNARTIRSIPLKLREQKSQTGSRNWKCAAKCSFREKCSSGSMPNAKSRMNRALPIRATPPRELSASSIRNRRQPQARHVCLRSARRRAKAVRHALGGAQLDGERRVSESIRSESFAARSKK